MLTPLILKEDLALLSYAKAIHFFHEKNVDTANNDECKLWEK